MSGVDTVRLPGGRTMTRARAKALGYLNAAGHVQPEKVPDSQGLKRAERERRANEWAEKQGVKAQPIVLRPRNVDPAGEPVVDPEVLNAIAARTAQIEAGEEPTVAIPEPVATADEDGDSTEPGDVPGGPGPDQVSDEVADLLAEADADAEEAGSA